jgi:hypothetical protein
MAALLDGAILLAVFAVCFGIPAAIGLWQEKRRG